MKWRRIAALLCVVAFFACSPRPAMATKYVALGDSYSSGTGTRTFYESTCQRSVYAYPYLLHNAHPEWTFVNATCSGAKTGDIINTQVNSVTSDTNWVTYTIGGNDAGFSSVITTCAQPSWASNCDGAINTAQSYIANTLPGRLDLVNNAIKSRAPSAKVDRPRLPAACSTANDCNAFTWFSPSEETRLNQTADNAEERGQRRGDARAGANFVFRDVIPPFVGHAVCDGGGGSSTEWINGLSNPTGESYHPKVTGHASGYYPVVKGVTG